MEGNKACPNDLFCSLEFLKPFVNHVAMNEQATPRKSEAADHFGWKELSSFSSDGNKCTLTCFTLYQVS